MDVGPGGCSFCGDSWRGRGAWGIWTWGLGVMGRRGRGTWGSWVKAFRNDGGMTGPGGGSGRRQEAKKKPALGGRYDSRELQERYQQVYGGSEEDSYSNYLPGYACEPKTLPVVFVSTGIAFLFAELPHRPAAVGVTEVFFKIPYQICTPPASFAFCSSSSQSGV